ncbi:hypothetical protein H7827_09440 [Streptomyces sp. JH002]|uniref:hypothetical protein n=1 Tax=Streptomyces sp. JH002 TaxID=2763259 RepID=UPI003D806425
MPGIRRPDGTPYPYVVRCTVPDGRENEWGYDTWEQADRQRRAITEMFRNAGEAVVITVLTPFNPLRYEVEGDVPPPAPPSPAKPAPITPAADARPMQEGNGFPSVSGISSPLCPERGGHRLPDSALGMITGDEGNVVAALAAAYEGCEHCTSRVKRRVADGDRHLVVLMAAAWLCSYAQIRASQGRPPAQCADELFPPVFLKDLDPRTRRLLRRLVLEPVEAPDGRAAAQPGSLELADLVINIADDDEIVALWHDALDGAVGVVLMEAFRW